MGLGRNIADLSVGLDLNDQGFTSDLAAADARAQAMMRRLDGMRAEMDIRADLDDVEKKYQRARALAKKWEHTRATATLDVDKAKAERVLKGFRTQLQSLSKERVTLEVELDKRGKAERGLAALERHMKRLGQTTKDTGRAVSGAAGDVDVMTTAVRRNRRAIDDSNNSLLRWIRSITHMTVRVGPFTAQLNQLARATLLLGPIITGLAGSLIALGSVLGAGLVGAFGLASAGLAGFTFAAGGLAAAIGPMREELKQVTQLSDAYGKAVLKYGKGSKEAKNAQEKLNHALKGVSPEAREAFQMLGMLESRWKRLSAPARTALFEVMGQGLKAVNQLMPTFGAHTNRTAKIIEQAFGRGFRSIGKGRGRNLLEEIFGGFNDALPDMLRTFGALGAANAKFVAAFSRGPFREAVRDFGQFTDHLNRLASDRARMDNMADSTTRAATSLSRFGAAAGRVFIALGKGAFGPGMSLMQDMTTGLDQLADRMNTVSGQARLASFFQQSADMARQLWSVLKPLGSLFFEFTTIMRPFTEAALSVARALAEITQAVASMGPVKGILMGLFGVGIAKNLVGIAKHVPGLSAVLKGAGTLRPAVAPAVAAGGSAALAARLTGGAAAGGASVGRLAAMRAGFMRLAPAIGIAVTAVSAFTAGMRALVNAGSKTREANEQFLEQVKIADNARGAYKGLRDNISNVGSALNTSNLNLRMFKEQLKDTKKGTLEHKLALAGYRDELRNNLALKREWRSQSKALTEATDTEVDAAHKAIEKFRERNDLQKEEIANLSKLTAGRAGQFRVSGRSEKEAAALAAEQAQLYVRLMHARNRDAAATINQARALRGLATVGGQAEQALGKLARQRPNLAQKIGLKFDTPQAVGKVSQEVNNALRGGMGFKAVLKIVADARDAEEAIVKLRSVRLERKLQRVGAQGVDVVLGQLSAVDRKRIREKIAHIRENGGKVTLAMIARIIARQIGDKRFSINAAADGALRQIAAVQASMASVHDKTVYINVIKRFTSTTAAETREASGGGPGRARTALVGEGNRHEYVVDKKQGFAFRTEGPMVLPLSDEAYVIPTESTFAGRGRSLLMQAARDLGIPGFKRGKRGKGPTHHLTPFQKKQLTPDPSQVPAALRFGGVPEEPLRDDLQDARQAYNRRDRSIHSLDKQINTAEASYGRMKAGTAKDAAKKRLDALKSRRRALYEGTGSGLNNSLKDLYAQYQKAEQRFQAVRRINQKLENLDTVQQTQAQIMANAARTRDFGAFRAAKSTRNKALKRRRALLVRALAHAKPGSKLALALAQQVAEVDGQKIDASDTFNDAAGTSGTQTLEGWIEGLGLSGQLEFLRRAEAVATTTATDSDDKAARAGLFNFFKGLAERRDLPKFPEHLRTEAFSLAGSYADFASSTASADVSPDLQAQLDQANTNLANARREAQLNAAWATVAGGPGDVGMGGFQSGRQAGAAGGGFGQSPTFIIQTLHPGDPSVLQAIGGAAAAGFGYQGFRDTPREPKRY